MAVAPAPTPMSEASPPPAKTGVPLSSPSSAAAVGVIGPTSADSGTISGRCSGRTPKRCISQGLHSQVPPRVSARKVANAESVLIVKRPVLRAVR